MLRKISSFNLWLTAVIVLAAGSVQFEKQLGFWNWQLERLNDIRAEQAVNDLRFWTFSALPKAAAITALLAVLFRVAAALRSQK